MKRKMPFWLPIVAAMLSFPTPIAAQADSLPPAWIYKGSASITFSQVSYSNWVAGGENAYALNSNIDLLANYARGKNEWENNLKLGYGFSWQESIKRKQNTLDVIDLSSKYGRKASERWLYTVLLGFKTQFDKGYASAKDTAKSSDFLSPAYLTLSVGMDYKNKGFSMFVSPVSGKMTMVNSPYLSSMGMFGVDSGRVVRMELGGLLKLGYEKNFWKERVRLKTTLELFSNYMEHPENVDVDWNFALDFKLGKGFSAQLMLRALYDDDARVSVDNGDGTTRKVAKLQFREFVGLGLAYSFDTSKR